MIKIDFIDGGLSQDIYLALRCSTNNEYQKDFQGEPDIRVIFINKENNINSIEGYLIGSIPCIIFSLEEKSESLYKKIEGFQNIPRVTIIDSLVPSVDAYNATDCTFGHNIKNLNLVSFVCKPYKGDLTLEAKNHVISFLIESSHWYMKQDIHYCTGDKDWKKLWKGGVKGNVLKKLREYSRSFLS